MLSKKFQFQSQFQLKLILSLNYIPVQLKICIGKKKCIAVWHYAQTVQITGNRKNVEQRRLIRDKFLRKQIHDLHKSMNYVRQLNINEAEATN